MGKFVEMRCSPTWSVSCFTSSIILITNVLQWTDATMELPLVATPMIKRNTPKEMGSGVNAPTKVETANRQPNIRNDKDLPNLKKRAVRE